MVAGALTGPDLGNPARNKKSSAPGNQFMFVSDAGVPLSKYNIYVGIFVVRNKELLWVFKTIPVEMWYLRYLWTCGRPRQLQYVMVLHKVVTM